MEFLPGSKLGSIVHSRTSTFASPCPASSAWIRKIMLTYGTVWGTLRTLLRKISQSQRGIHHDSPYSRVPTTHRQGRRTAASSRLARATQGRWCKNTKQTTTTTTWLAQRQEGAWWLQGVRSGTGTCCSTHPELQLCKLKRFWR